MFVHLCLLVVWLDECLGVLLVECADIVTIFLATKRRKMARQTQKKSLKLLVGQIQVKMTPTGM